MARRNRFAPPGYSLHLTQRGNYRQTVVSSDADREHFLSLLETHSEERGVRIAAYTLMSNHFHLVVAGDRPDAVSLFMMNVNDQYSAYRHAAQKLRGHLWQGRFFSCVLDDDHHKFQCRALFRGRRAIKSARTTIRPLANRDKPSDIPTRVPFDIDVERILGVEGATLMTVRDELHRIVDELPDAELFELRHIVDDLKSGMEAEESVGAESLTAIQEGLADLKAGRTVNWETVKHENGL